MKCRFFVHAIFEHNIIHNIYLNGSFLSTVTAPVYYIYLSSSIRNDVLEAVVDSKDPDERGTQQI